MILKVVRAALTGASVAVMAQYWPVRQLILPVVPDGIGRRRVTRPHWRVLALQLECDQGEAAHGQ
jgi:hypothetical protein